MKKAAIIFLLFIYALSATGFALRADYCCNNLTSLKLVLADGAKDKNGCCPVKYQSFKIKDVHSAADILTAPTLHFNFIETNNSLFTTSNLFSIEDNQFAHIHAPPLRSATPVYISNCVFRI
jgi:hypothetical protein